MAIPQLKNMYPFWADRIDQLRSEGFEDEDILRGITDAVGEIKGSGLSEDEIGTIVGGRLFEPPRPTAGERFRAGAVEALTFGFKPSELEPAVGLGEALPELAGQFAGFAPTAVASELLAVRALAPLLRGLSPVAAGAIRGAGAGAIATIPGAAAETIQTGEFPTGTLEAAPANIALFALANLLGPVRAARRGGVPGIAAPPGAPRIIGEPGVGQFEPGGESAFPGREFVGKTTIPVVREPGVPETLPIPGGETMFPGREPLPEIPIPIAPEVVASRGGPAITDPVTGEAIFPPKKPISRPRKVARARAGQEPVERIAPSAQELHQLHVARAEEPRLFDLTDVEAATVDKAVTPREQASIVTKIKATVKPEAPVAKIVEPRLKDFMDAMRKTVEDDPIEVRVSEPGKPAQNLVLDEIKGPRKKTKIEEQLERIVERHPRRTKLEPLVDETEQVTIGRTIRDILGLRASKKAARSAQLAEIRALADFRENRAVLAELARDPTISSTELNAFADRINTIRDSSMLPPDMKATFYGDARQFVAGIRAQAAAAPRAEVPARARTAEDIRRIAERRAQLRRAPTVRVAEVTAPEILRGGPEPRVKVRAVSGRDIFEAIKFNDVTRRAGTEKLRTLLDEAQKQGLTVERLPVERSATGPGVADVIRLRGKVFGKEFQTPFLDVDAALAAIRIEKPFESSLSLEEIKSPGRVTESYLLQREGDRITAKVQRISNKAFRCLSPCVERGEILSEAEKKQLFEAAKGTLLEEQLRGPVNTSWLQRFGEWFKTMKNRPFLPEIFSPSFNLDRFPVGKDLISKTDITYRDMGKYVERRLEKVYGTMGKRGRIGGPVPFTYGSMEAKAVGFLLENPEMASRMPKPIQTAAAAYRSAFEDMIREYGLARPADKVGRIKNYLPHLFDRELLITELRQEIGLLEKSTRPVDRARAVQMQETLTLMEGGGWPVYEAIPTRLRNRFFETRKGRAGYDFDAVKAHDVYLGVLSRKLYLEPLLKEFEPRLKEFPMEFRALAKEYLRQATQIKETIPDAVNEIANIAREIQFVRLIGFNPLSSGKNMFQALFALPELGTKHWGRGVAMTFTREGQALFDKSGHGLDIPHIYLNRRNFMHPLWAKVVDYSGFLFNKVERGNRTITYLGALDKWFTQNGAKVGMTLQDALSSGSLPEAAARFANDLVRKAQFRYGTVDLPLFLRKPIFGTAFQFSSFPIKATELMWKWIAREGNTGRLKLMGFVMAGSGISGLGALVGHPTLGDGTASPVNLAEMFDAMQAMTEGDWAKAKSELSRVVQPDDFTFRFGPAGSIVERAGEIVRDVREGRDVSSTIQRFGLREILPAQAVRLWTAAQQVEAGGSPRDFVSTALGFPTHDSIIRRQYLTLLELGRNEVAANLLDEYRRARGGSLPIDYSTTRRMSAEVKKEKKARREEIKRESRSEKIRRQLPSRIEDTLFSLGRSVL